MNKILVVGASIAGPVVCYWLKKIGFKPTLIEKNDQIRKGGYAVDILGIAIEVVKKMGVLEAIAAQRTSIQRSRHVDALGYTLREDEPETAGFRLGEDVEMSRGDLVQIFMDLIPDVPCHFAQSIVELDQQQDGVVVTFADGSIECYDLVIGADGLHSKTRRLAFLDSDYTKVDLGACIGVANIPNVLNIDHEEVLFEAHNKSIHYVSDRDPNMAQVGFMFRSDKHSIGHAEEQK